MQAQNIYVIFAVIWYSKTVLCHWSQLDEVKQTISRKRDELESMMADRQNNLLRFRTDNDLIKSTVDNFSRSLMQDLKETSHNIEM